MIFQVETIDLFFVGIIFVHGYNGLESHFLASVSTEFQGTDNLASIDSVKNVAVMDHEAWSYSTFGAESHEHHVKAENLYILDSFTS